MSEPTISFDEFQALEQKVLRAVEVIRREREARAAAETEVATLRELLDIQTAETTEARSRIENMSQERENVRVRVEAMLTQMDELL
jgi:hypothetical protein